MDVFLPPEILYRPYAPGPYRMAMGLTAEKFSGLIELDATYPAQMAERRRLLAERAADVVAALQGAETACAELLALLQEFLPRRFPEFFARGENGFENRLTGECVTEDARGKRCLALAARLVPEDFCLLRVTDEGPVLIAAALCFPARWVLAEKLGRALAAVHAPVPFYGARLAAPVDRFIAALKPGRLAVRLNWSLLDDASLFQSNNAALFQSDGKSSPAPDPAITPGNAVEKIFLRVERQSFFRLVASGTVCFAIRTHVYPLTRVLAQPGEAARLAAAIRAMPDEMARYKNFPKFRAALLVALDGFPSEPKSL